jgi:hypothetical protein
MPIVIMMRGRTCRPYAIKKMLAERPRLRFDMAQAARHGFAAMRKRTVTVNDKMQNGCHYVLSL